MEAIEEHIVPPGVAPVRLSDYLHQVFETLPSRKGGKKAIQGGAVQVNGQPATTGVWVKPGMVISLIDLNRNPPKPFPLGIPILYEDDFLAVVHKPPGLSVSGNHYRTLLNALVGQLAITPAEDALPWGMPVHRLDAPTSGPVVVAKTRRAQVLLGQAFEARTVRKVYQAIVCGRAPDSGTLDGDLDGKPALTTFQKLEECRSLNCEWLSWLELHLHTGRTHQIRRHLAHLGTPILGDDAYTPEDKPLLRKKGLFLSAVSIAFDHPCEQGKVKVEAPPPEKFRAMMERSERYFLNKNK
ncbi:MAG: RluA family pseudouridine synthase [Phaeodactylibacter sp.]|uniref:RluA family pseudouridine synthase n=1 Tax=Phaeodactylibacter sp. TaxID=1940289 RepID=UPI0032EDCE84